MGPSPERNLLEGSTSGRWGQEKRTHDANERTAIADQLAAASAENPGHGPATTGSQRKRKNEGLDGSSLQGEEIPKKAKLILSEADDMRYESGSRPDITRRLPAEIWQHIFSYSTPRSLGKLLSVNKLFHQYLDPTSRVVKTDTPVSTSPSALPALKPEAIWQASRRLHWPRMPVPLKGRSEVEMWRLACCQTCQFCKRKGENKAQQGLSNWHTGPGAKDVSPVFPFFIVSCGQCLSEKCTKEIDVILSSAIPYFLLASLPMILLSSDRHIVAPQTLRSGLPSHIILTKMFWPEHFQKAKADLEAVLKLGPAAGEEWVKGFDTKSKGFLADVSRWEKWYLSGGVHQMRQSELTESNSPVKKTSATVPSAKVTDLPSSGKRFVVLDGQKQVDINAGHSGTSQKPQIGSQHPQNIIEKQAMKLKTERRIEIVKRASQLDPPITPRDLIHIPLFRDALQIISPFDDVAWEHLKPRLQAQHRTVVAKREKANAAVSHRAPGKEATDGEWNQAQAPLRTQISKYADEIIKNHWGSGSKVKKNNCSTFAVEVLLQVRKRFYDQVTEDAMIAIASGSVPVADPLGGPWTQKLTLENMRALFEAKIKPYIHHSWKALFLCSICEKNGKHYGLEAVVQHFAAKHTHTLSKQNIVVNWRAEWPEQPVFTFDAGDAAKQNPPTVAAGSSSQVMTDASRLETSSNAVATQQSQLSVALPTHGKDDNGGASGSAEGHTNPSKPKQSFYPHFHSRIKPDARFNHIRPSDPYRLGVDFMANVAKDAWKNLASVKNIPGSVKIYTIIHHITKDFQRKYAEPAPFEMFHDGISNHESFAPLRTVSNLACRACMSSPGSQKRPLYTLLGLVDHFNQTHGKHMIERNAPPEDWRVDMLWLPDSGALEGLETALRKKKPALRLICDALPWAFKGKAIDEEKEAETQESESSHTSDSHAKSAARPQDPAPVPYSAPQQDQPSRESRVIDDKPLLRPASVVYGRNTRYQGVHSPPRQQASGPVQGFSQEQAFKQEHRHAAAQVAGSTKVQDGHVAPSNSRQFASMPGVGQMDQGSSTHLQGPANQVKQEEGKGKQPDRDLDDVEFIESRKVVRDHRERSVSPRPVHSHKQAMFRQRSPRPAAYAQMPAEYRGGYSAHPVPPFTMYELYEVQDPRGDYVIRRPVRAEEREVMAFAPQDRRDSGWIPYYTPAHDYAPPPPLPPPERHHAFYGGGERAPPGAKPTEYADYDPRYPATGSYRDASSAHHARRP